MTDNSTPKRLWASYRPSTIRVSPVQVEDTAEYIRADVAAKQLADANERVHEANKTADWQLEQADGLRRMLAERDARIAELEAAMRDIARWRQEDQDDVEIAILQWRGCVAIARGALGVTDVTP